MASDPKILFLTGSLEAGGLERFVTSASIAGLNSKVFTPAVLCLSKRKGLFVEVLESNSIEVFEAPQGWQRKIRSLIALGRLLHKINPNVVHSQVNFSLVQQWFATRFFTSAKFMITERNCYPLQGWALTRRRLQFHFLRLLGVHYSGNSVEVVKYLAKMVRYPERKIPVIPNGIEIPLNDPVVRKRIREQQGWGPQDFVVGYVARFAEHKGQHYFLQVMEIVHHQLGNRLKVCFIGDGPVRSSIQDSANFSNMAHLFSFLGVVDNVHDYYQSFDCTALLSDYEGMPNVVLEAMAYGLPVIANPVGNVVELFEHGGGVVNRSHDLKQTAYLFLDLAENSQKREEIGTLAKQKIKSSFSIQHTLKLLSKYYDIG